MFNQSQKFFLIFLTLFISSAHAMKRSNIDDQTQVNNQKDKWGYTPLAQAVCAKNLEMTKKLLHEGHSLLNAGPNNNTVFTYITLTKNPIEFAETLITNARFNFHDPLKEKVLETALVLRNKIPKELVSKVLSNLLKISPDKDCNLLLPQTEKNVDSLIEILQTSKNNFGQNISKAVLMQHRLDKQTEDKILPLLNGEQLQKDWKNFKNTDRSKLPKNNLVLQIHENCHQQLLEHYQNKKI